MNRLRAQTHDVYRDRVASGFSHLIVEPEMLDQLGPAIASRKALFLYGPPGNGKSVMGEGIGKVLGGDIYIPYAIDVDGQIITMFDPVTHESRGEDDEHSVIRADDAIDRRWVRVGRPVITVGGELTLEMLDLRYGDLSKFYESPVHLKANGGVLVVDDFGRQRVPARDLLNRWIVPLESRVDYLNLHTGRKFQVPFDVLVVFATNLEPRSLADEAFLRRIPYKILAKNPTLDQFGRIWEMNCRRHGVPFDPVDRAVPERQVLHRAQLGDARLPSARPDGSGREPLPLPPEARGDHTGSARCGVSELLPGGRADGDDGRVCTVKPMLKRLKTGLRDCSGTNLLEAAIVTPLLLVLTFGIVDFASMFYTYLALESGVSQATRYAVTGNPMDDPDNPGTPLNREAAIRAAMQDATPTIDMDNVSFTFTHMVPGSSSWTGGAGGPGDIGRVSVAYTWTPLTPILRPLLTNGQLTVRAESAMKNESRFE